ncbi:MAG: 2'-5' RNA ligase family protein [Victivallaceae bacterium]
MQVKDIFQASTYIVLNVPSPVADRVKEIRRCFDPDRSHLSVEITLAGSGGLGTVMAGQNPEETFAKLAGIAKSITPFEAEFGHVERFPDTGIYYYTLKQPEHFINVHNMLFASGIKFNPIKYPFTPHCTLKLALKTECSEDDFISRIQPPHETFVINTMSIYSLEEKDEPKLLHRVNLSG